MSSAEQSATEDPSVFFTLGTVGRKSGRPVRSELRAHRVAGRLFVVASKAGADRHPDWFHNLAANADVTVTLESEEYPATARPLDAPERDVVFAEICAAAPAFAEYQQRTDRVLPVVELIRR